MTSARGRRPLDANPSKTEQMLMILGSDPVDKEATNGPPLRSEANNVSITDGPLNSIKTQAIHSPPASCPLDPLPSQATGVFPLKSDSSVKIVEAQQQVRNEATLQTGCPAAHHSCISSASTKPGPPVDHPPCPMESHTASTNYRMVTTGDGHDQPRTDAETLQSTIWFPTYRSLNPNPQNPQSKWPVSKQVHSKKRFSRNIV